MSIAALCVYEATAPAPCFSPGLQVLATLQPLLLICILFLGPLTAALYRFTHRARSEFWGHSIRHPKKGDSQEEGGEEDGRTGPGIQRSFLQQTRDFIVVRGGLALCSAAVLLSSVYFIAACTPASLPPFLVHRL